MEADLKIQAAIAVGMLGTVAVASSAFDYIDYALRTVHAVDTVMTSQGIPDTAAQELTSIHDGPATHSIALARREVADLHMSVGVAMVVLSRWLEPRLTGLQGLPAAAWRVRAEELVQAVTRARESLEQAAASCYSASAVLDVATMAWSILTPNIGSAWMMDASRSLLSTRDHLNEARDSLTKMCSAAVRAHAAAKILVDLL